MIVGNILSMKNADVVCVESGESCRAAARIMTERRIGALIVTDKAGCVAGIFSERDVLRGVAVEGHAIFDLTVGDLMTRDVLTLTPQARIDDVMALMTDRRVRHFPVIENGVLAGIVSIGDIVKYKIAEAEHETQALRAYIVG